MPQTSPTFRVFVSSTFSDLKAERDALQKYVFPRLSDLAESHGCHFQAIDLRWGVSEEAALDQQTMKICLGEIERCQQISPRPNFIILLGDRYGWIPLPYMIPVDEMELILARITEVERKLVLWDETPLEPKEILQCGVSWTDGKPQGGKGWYRLDTNAVPPAYVLQPRLKDSPFEEYNYWTQQVEIPLREILNRAATNLKLPPAQMLKYSASATHQEIMQGALNVDDARNHVFGFFRTIDKLENDLARSSGESLLDPQAGNFIDLNSSGKFDKAKHRSVKKLKRELASCLPKNIHTFHARWHRNGLSKHHIGHLPETLEECLSILSPSRIPATFESAHYLSGYSRTQPKKKNWLKNFLEKFHLKGAGGQSAPVLHETRTLCEAVWVSLAQIILAEVDEFKKANKFKAESEIHQEFSAQKLNGFTGREDLLEAVGNYIEPTGGERLAEALGTKITSQPNLPMVIYGAAGIGKTSFMAKAAKQAQSKYPQAMVITRFVGATPNSLDSSELAHDICYEIENTTNEKKYHSSLEHRGLVVDLVECLEVATPKRPVFIFIDAIDQLSINGGSDPALWMPRRLPGEVRLVVSTQSGKHFEALRKHLVRFIKPEEEKRLQCVLLPSLKSGQGKEILNLWLEQSGRCLTDLQHREVLSKFEGSGCLPLYLKLAFEEACRWHSYDGLPALIDGGRGLAKDIPGMLNEFFQRLEQPINHKPQLVIHALGYLAAARYGLSEGELLSALWQNDDVRQECFIQTARISNQIDRLPFVLWSRLFFDLQPYLAIRSSGEFRLLGFHSQQVAEIARQHYLSVEVKTQRHCDLARLFSAQPNWRDNHRQHPNARKAAELPFHLAAGNLDDEMYELLTDFDFLEIKCRTSGVDDLEADFRTAISNSYNWILEKLLERLQLEFANLQKAPELLFPQFANSFNWSDNSDLLKINETARQKRAEQVKSGQVSMSGWLQGLHDPRPALPMWEHSLGGDANGLVNSIALTDDGLAVVACSATIQVWDVEYDQKTEKAFRKSFAPDMEFDASNIIEGGRLKISLQGHASNICALAITADKRIVSGSNDGEIRVWDLRRGDLLRTINVGYHLDDLALLGDDRLITATSGCDIRILDLNTGKLLLRSQKTFGDEYFYSGMVLTGDARALIGAEHGLIRVLDIETGVLLDEIKVDGLQRLALTGDGKLVMVIRQNKKDWIDIVQVWDLESMKPLLTLEGSIYNSQLLILANDAIAVCASMERDNISSSKLNVWDLENGGLLFSIDINGDILSLTPDKQGRIFVGNSRGEILIYDLESCRLVGHLGPKGHCLGISVLAVSDKNQIISGSEDWQIKLWDVDQVEYPNRGWEHTYSGHRAPVTALTVLEDGSIISAAEDTTVRVWGPTRPNNVLNNVGRAQALFAFTHFVFIGTKEGVVYLWDVEKNKLSIVVQGITFGVKSIFLGKNILFASTIGGDIKAWDIMNDFNPLPPLRGHLKQVNSLSVTPDQQFLISGSEDRTIKVWNLSNMQLEQTLEGHSDSVNAVVVTPEGQVASASDDWSIKLWDPNNGKLLRTLEGHSAPVLSLAMLPGGKLVSGSADTTIKVWDLKSGRVPRFAEQRILGVGDWSVSGFYRKSSQALHCLEGHPNQPVSLLAFTKGERIISRSIDSTVKVWDVCSGELVFTAAGNLTALNPEHSFLAGSFDDTITIWELTSGWRLEPIIWEADQGKKMDRIFEVHRRQSNDPDALGLITGTDWITALTLSHNGWVIAGAADGKIAAWDMENGQSQYVIHGHTNAVILLSISSDGKLISTAENDPYIKIWDLPTGNLLCSLEGRTKEIESVEKGHTEEIESVLSIENGRLVSASRDDFGTLKYWDMQNGQFLCSNWPIDKRSATLKHEMHPLYFEREFISAANPLLKLNEMIHQTKYRSAMGFFRSNEKIESIVLTADRWRCIFSKYDCYIYIRDLKTYKQNALFANGCRVSALALSEDERWLACGDDQGRVRLFEFIHEGE